MLSLRHASIACISFSFRVAFSLLQFSLMNCERELHLFGYLSKYIMVYTIVSIYFLAHWHYQSSFALWFIYHCVHIFHPFVFFSTTFLDIVQISHFLWQNHDIFSFTSLDIGIVFVVTLINLRNDSSLCNILFWILSKYIYSEKYI